MLTEDTKDEIDERQQDGDIQHRRDRLQNRLHLAQSRQQDNEPIADAIDVDVESQMPPNPV